MRSKMLLAWFAVLVLGLGALGAAASSTPKTEPVRIIFDTDIGNDVDDVMALAMLHALQARGDCELLGVTITKPDELAGPFVDAINTFYGRPGLPIGFTRAGLKNEPSKFLSLADVKEAGKLRYPHSLKRSSDAPAAAQVLRQLLSRQPDDSVVIIQVGFFSNLGALLDTPADARSPLPGRALVQLKVRMLSVMAGAFQTIEHNNHYTEYNVINDVPAAQKLARDWPTPIVWSGFEIGVAVPFPARSIERDFGYVPHHPVAEAYCLYNPPPHERPTWDLTSTLYAVFPDRGFFTLSTPGQVTVENDGFTRFTPAPGGRDRFLIVSDAQALRVKEALVQLTSEPPHSSAAPVERMEPLKAPEASGLFLKSGDRLAIIGDSITEQKRYSRLMEDYLTVCAPDLKVSVRQYGWNGETTPGFLARMTNDCLRFQPTIATTCYGMNDHAYRPYEDWIGNAYRKNSRAIIEAFKSSGVRVVLGSPGCLGKVPAWAKNTNDSLESLNLNLCKLRNIDVELAREEKVRFADVFWPMLTQGAVARKEYGAGYAIAGADGVHPDWAGHTIMAYAFLKAFGLPGDIGTFTVDLAANKVKVSKGHSVKSAAEGRFEIQSERYPFCPSVPAGMNAAAYPVCGQDDPARSDSIRSGMTLVPFNQDLNRLVLVVQHAGAPSYRVNWGNQSKSFSKEQLAKGVNLAEEFPVNPFSEAFAKVDAAVAAKQAYETRQVKQLFRSPEAKINLQAVVAQSEQERQGFVDAIRAAFVPVTHTLVIQPE